MNTSSIQYSFAAGSTSLDPHGFRVIGTETPGRVSEIVSHFPVMRRYWNSSALIINGYPAALGGMGNGPFVDTYLHAITFIRAMRLAACERRHVIFLSQPLCGADFILQLCRTDFDLPQELLWAVGGYFLPQSLECALRERLRTRRCELSCLYSYGVAEIGHSCFVATQRLDSGEPRYVKIATDVAAEISPETQRLTLSNLAGRSVTTTDTAQQVGDEWMIQSGADRLAPSIKAYLESWSAADWDRRTGYLTSDGERTVAQLRDHVVRPMKTELAHYEYLSRFGGSFSCKPKWHIERSWPDQAAESPDR